MTPSELNNKLEKLLADYQAFTALMKEEGITFKELSKEKQQGLRIAKELLVAHAKSKKTLPQGEEDISVTTFVNICLAWRAEFVTFFDKMAQSHEAVDIQVASFKQHLSRHQSATPITQILYQEWQQVLDTLSTQGDTITGSQLFTALRDHKGEAWAMTNDIAQLEAHYKKKQMLYKKIEGEGIKVLLPKVQIFVDALQASSNKKDPNLPENREEAEEDRAEALERMRADWKNWLNHITIPDLGELDTATEGKLIDVALLEKNRNNYLECPSYAEAFCLALRDAVIAETKALKGTPSYEQVITIAIGELTTSFNAHVTEEFLQKGVESGEMNLPSGLKRWIVNSIDKNEDLYERFVEACGAWAAEVRGVTGEAEAANKNRSFKVDRKKWVAQLQGLFQGRAGSLVDPLTQALPQEPILSLKMVQEAWIKGLQALQSEPTLEALWVEQFTKSGEGNVEQAITTFKTELPALTLLEQALLDAQHTTAQERFPAIADSLKGSIRLTPTDGKDYWVQVDYDLPLHYQRVPMGSESLPYPITKAAGASFATTKKGQYKASVEGEAKVGAAQADASVPQVTWEQVIPLRLTDTTVTSSGTSITEASGGFSLGGGAKGASATYNRSFEQKGSNKGSSQESGLDGLVELRLSLIAHNANRPDQLEVRALGVAFAQKTAATEGWNLALQHPNQYAVLVDKLTS